MTALFSDPALGIARAVAFGLVGCLVGNVVCRWIVRLTEPEGEATSGGADVSTPTLSNVGSNSSPWWQFLPLVGGLVSRGARTYRGERIGMWWPMVELGTGLLFGAFACAYLDLRCQVVPEVAPSEVWRIARLFYHLVLITLLVTATGTDFRDFTISDWITVPGMIIGVLAATVSGELQTIHVWVDWNDPLWELYGPYLPEWMKEHHHLHGLVWSLCGLVAGGGVTQIVRLLSKWILGQEAMGFGDVTLMAMIGSFIGWQPVLFVFLLAPLCGLAISLATRLVTGRTFLPYGPYLSAATLLVLFGWRWLWMLELPISADRKFSIRLLMGDWQQLAWMAAIALGGLTLLLGFVRLYRSVPIGSRTK